MIIDDVLDDAKLARRAIAKVFPEIPIMIFGSAREAITYLDEGPTPFLILLDLRMPEMDGFAFLEWLKSQAKHAGAPVVVLSGQHELEHLKRAYALQARAFLIKPIDQESLRSVLISLNFAI